MNKVMSFFAGVLSGLAVGAVTAVLFAPASGEQLQSSVRNRIKDVFDEAQKEQEATEARLRQEAGMMGISLKETTPQNGAGYPLNTH